MEDSSCGNSCSFVTSGFCKSETECPFYLETWWRKSDNPTPKLVKDCFPKKFAFEQNQLLHRFLGMQSALEEMRNKFSALENVIMNLVVESKEALKEEKAAISRVKTDPKLIQEVEK